MSIGPRNYNSPVSLSWGLQALGVQGLWGRGLTGASVLIGHLDTGLIADHPALAGKVQEYAEFDDDGELIPNQPARDSAGHGSHTAGLVCGGMIEYEAIGVAPEARLISASVIDSGNNIIRILQGLSWLRQKNIRILCMALGIPSENPIFWTMLSALKRAGVLLVCPIGNHGSAVAHAPGHYPFVLSVGAVDKDLHLSSSTGALLDSSGCCIKPELLAPGVCIPSVSPHFAPAVTRSGSSQACALVAGASALLCQAYPHATPNQLAWALCQSAQAVDKQKGIRYRHGLIQVERALSLLESGAPSGDGGQANEHSLPFYRDPELLDQLREAPSDALHDCVWISAEDDEANGDPRGASGIVAEQIALHIQEKPVRSGFLPEARVGWVRASKRFIKTLHNSPSVTVLSAARGLNRVVLGRGFMGG